MESVTIQEGSQAWSQNAQMEKAAWGTKIAKQ